MNTLTTILADSSVIYWGLLLLFGVIAVACFAAAVYGSQFQGRDTRFGFRAVLVTTGLWVAFQAMGLLTVDERLSSALYIGGLIWGLTGVGAWVYFVSAYTGRSYHRNRRYRGLAVGVYVGLLVVKLTNPLYGLYVVTRFEPNPYPHLVVEPQLFYLLSFTLTYTLVAISFYWLLDTFRSSSYPTVGLGALAVLSLLPVVPRVAVVVLPAGVLPPFLFGLSFEPIGVAAFTLGTLVFVEDTFRRVGKSARTEFFETADDATFVYDAGGGLVESNDQAEYLQSRLGVECATLETFERVFDPASGDDGSGVVSFDIEGATRYFAPTVTTVGTGAQTTGTVARVAEVTERRERREELELKQRAMDEATVGITISDPDVDDNPLVYVNDGFVEQTGYSREEALGRNCRFLQAGDRDQSALDDLRDAIAAEEPTTVDLRNYRKDGEQFWNRLSVTPVHDEGGELSSYIGIQQDVTAEKERTRRFEVLFNSTFQFIALLEPDGTVISVNDAALDFGGFDRTGVVGQRFYDASWWTHSSDVNDRLRNALDRAVDGEFVRYETTVKGEDGFATLDFSVKPVTDDAGDVTLLVAEGRDITEQKQERQRMAMMQRVMRHNMRNDLNKVRGWAQVIAEESDAEARADQLDHIERTLDDWEAMGEEIKKIRQISQSTDVHRPGTEALSAVADAVSHSREAHPALEIEANTEDAGGLRIPSVVEDAISALIRVVADRQTDEAAQVDVSLSDSTDGWIQIDIADTGGRLTEMEAQVLATGEETALIHGQGTGVWLVRTMIKEAGGDISAQRRDAEATVSFRVPATHST